MFQVSLHINSQIVNEFTGEVTDNWYDADLDPQVNISLNDSIKDAKDVGKVMTAYTNQFKLPASKRNNKTFKYFHNHNVLQGFDSRRKHEAILKLNGFDFKKGYIKLNKVNLKDNYPLSYDIQFFGELSSLKDTLGKAELKDLTSLNKYNHEYNIDNVRDGFEEGLDFDFTTSPPTITKSVYGDIKYPLISHTRLFEYDNQKFHRLLSEEEKRDGHEVTSLDRLDYADLKPAIRVSKIFDAIEENFPTIKFDTSWIESSTAKFGSPFDDLFMWLHHEKSYISYGFDVENPIAPFNNLSIQLLRRLKDGTADDEYTYASGDGDFRPLQTYRGRYFTGTFTAEASADGAIWAAVILYKDGIIFSTQTQYSSNGSIGIDFDLRRDDGEGNMEILNGEWEIVTNCWAENTVGAVTPTLEIVRHSSDTEETSIYGGAAISLVSEILVPLLMPKKKIIDFLSDLFKMFNLVAYEERELDGSYKIVIEDLNTYYRRGISYDITQYIDISDSGVERVSPYSYIALKFPERKTFLAINQGKITGDDFGDAEFRVDYFDEGNNTNSTYLFDGGEYTIEPKFEKVMYERLENQAVFNDIELTNIQMGLYVNDNKENTPEPVLGEALLLYTYPQTTSSSSEVIEWSDGTNSTQYNKPANVKPDGSQTLHFNAEFDEWTYETNENSLFNKFYLNYIAGIYSPYARRVIVDAHLPSLIYSKIKLNDSIIIDRVVFLIESIKTNLTTGKSSLKLLRVTDLETKYIVPSEDQLVWNTEESLWNNKTETWDEITSGRVVEPNVSIQLMLRDLQARSTYYENETETIELLEELVRC